MKTATLLLLLAAVVPAADTTVLTSSDLKRRPAATPLPNPLQGSVLLEAGHDSNVLLLPSDSDSPEVDDRASAVVAVQLELGYRAINQRDQYLRVGVEARKNHNTSLQDRNLTRIGPVLTWGFSRGSLAWGVGASANHFRLEERRIARDGRVSLSASMLQTNWVTIASPEFAVLVYDDEQAQGRNARSPGISLRQWWLPEDNVSQRRVDAGVRILRYGANEAAQRYVGIRPSVGVVWRFGAVGDSRYEIC